MTNATRLISIASPHNPSGICVPDTDIHLILAAMSLRAPDALLFVDESYGAATYGDAPPRASVGSRAPSTSLDLVQGRHADASHPTLADTRNTGPIRLWVAGCATGEEAYSVAILLTEGLARSDCRRSAQIFATDGDDRAIGAARAGLYLGAIASDLSAERLERNFIKEDGRAEAPTAAASRSPDCTARICARVRRRVRKVAGSANPLAQLASSCDG